MRGTTEVRKSTATSGSLPLYKSDGLGVYHLHVTATDTLGKTATRNSSTITVQDDDTDAPVITLGGSIGSESREQTQEFTWSVVDATSGVGRVVVDVYNTSTGDRVSRQEDASASGRVNFDSYGPGTYRIDVWAQDSDND